MKERVRYALIGLCLAVMWLCGAGIIIIQTHDQRGLVTWGLVYLAATALVAAMMLVEW